MPIIIYSNIIESKTEILKNNKDKSGVYKITNKINGNFYIGSSINISNRFKKHLNISYISKNTNNNILYRAIKKYGFENFTLEILEYTPKDRQLLISREQYYLNFLLPTYNILKKAGSPLGFMHSEETKAKMSLSKKGNKYNLGKKHNEKTKNKIIKAQGFSVEILNVNTTEKFIFDSINQAAKFLNCSNNALSYSLKNNKLYKKTYKITRV